ncbi:MAG TPA: HEAT repeat domain-containing protein [Blastocatellia bacterium]|jgi:HEAT repeat protein|nr:HEAT repeat domain-containing protein [Blastocatellia bacterium]
MKSRILTTVALLILAVAQTAQLRTVRGDQSSGGPNRVADQPQRFINVEGADLKVRVEAAIKLARSRPQQSPFWVAYSFDVRPGVAVDPNVNVFNGSMTSLGSVTLFFGNSGGVPIETRNLGVFALLQPSDNSITRMEVYNLERQREYSGYPVYWLGRAGNQESLDHLRMIAESNSTRNVSEHATAAIGMHDAPQVVPVLKELVRKSPVTDVRADAIFWLGFAGGEQVFLADIVRNEREDMKVREAAAAAVGRGREAAVLPLLRDLYGQVTNRDVKEQLLRSIGKNEGQKAAADFLLKVAKTDADRELREAAIRMLGRLPGTQGALAGIVRDEQEQADVREAAVQTIARSQDAGAVPILEGLYKSVANSNVRESIINAVVKNPDQSAAKAFLVQIAKNDSSRELREGAVSRLGRLPGTQSMLAEIARSENESENVRQAAVSAITRSGDSTALSTLQDLYGSVSSREVKQQIVGAIAKNPDQDAALVFLVKVAEGDPSRELREQAISRLSRFSSAPSLEALTRIASSDADVELQAQAVMAISKRPNDEAVPLLIQLAKTHSRSEVREMAIRRLSKSNDERAKEFVRQLLTK